MQMGAGISKMALECYGYGRWDAPYWFIGPEQGMSQDEEVQKRVEAWLDLGGNDLSDCLAFHEKINEVRWHGLDGKQPRLQKTWKQLMLFLKVFLGTPMHLEKLEDKENLCSYQRDHWEGLLTRPASLNCADYLLIPINQARGKDAAYLRGSNTMHFDKRGLLLFVKKCSHIGLS